MALLELNDARALLAGISRSSLYKWYGECRKPLTPTRNGRQGWDSEALLKRRQELERARKRIARAAR